MTRIVMGTAAGMIAAAGASAATLDGLDIPADAALNGLELLATQDTPTGFGNSSGADQGAPFGSELNQAFGAIDGSTLKLSITGNLEANFNKFWIFFDADKKAGENTLAGDNADGGFGEINALGYTFDAGFAPDHGIRVEVGGGFFGLNFFDLVDNTAGSIWSAGGPGDLPLVNAAGGFGTTVGWDNTNALGVDDASAAGAATATKGWEFEIDMLTAFGFSPNFVKAQAIITSGDGTFTSNQSLAGVGGLANLGGSPDFSAIAGDQFFTIPSPGAVTVLGLGGLAAIRRRR